MNLFRSQNCRIALEAVEVQVAHRWQCVNVALYSNFHCLLRCLVMKPPGEGNVRAGSTRRLLRSRPPSPSISSMISSLRWMKQNETALGLVSFEKGWYLRTELHPQSSFQREKNHCFWFRLLLPVCWAWLEAFVIAGKDRLRLLPSDWAFSDRRAPRVHMPSPPVPERHVEISEPLAVGWSCLA